MVITVVHPVCPEAVFPVWVTWCPSGIHNNYRVNIPKRHANLFRIEREHTVEGFIARPSIVLRYRLVNLKKVGWPSGKGARTVALAAWVRVPSPLGHVAFPGSKKFL